MNLPFIIKGIRINIRGYGGISSVLKGPEGLVTWRQGERGQKMSLGHLVEEGL